MYVKTVLATLVLCAIVVEIKSDQNGHCEGCRYMQPYVRVKRGRYYSSPPQRFYSRPPISFPNRGVFSYTPPPNYMAEDNEPPYPGNPRPPKVSKRPTKDGLGDEDINNLVKYLSKQDLDKIIEFAGGKDRNSERYKDAPFDKYNNDFNKPNNNYNAISDQSPFDKYTSNRDEPNYIFQVPVEETDTEQKFSGPYQEQKSYTEYNNNNNNFVTQPTPLKAFYNEQIFNNKLNSNTPLQTEESMHNQITYAPQNSNINYSNDSGVLFTDSKTMQEEPLPRPVNLRDDQDFDVSFTNNVPTIVKAESNSYPLENFGELPLMNYHSKLDTLSSYHVPHYTVTSSKSTSSSYSSPPISSSSSSSYGPAPPVEPAPHTSAAKEQSDAHLKATRIWSHKSKGTAYTLHNDGSLSLERPLRPKPVYGHP